MQEDIKKMLLLLSLFRAIPSLLVQVALTLEQVRTVEMVAIPFLAPSPQRAAAAAAVKTMDFQKLVQTAVQVVAAVMQTSVEPVALAVKETMVATGLCGRR